MIIFDNDEEEYLKWVRNHPEGFVINAEKTQSGEAPYMMHLATCAFISSDKRTNYTTTTYKKVCSLDKTELVRWWRKHSTKEYQACSSCKP